MDHKTIANLETGQTDGQVRPHSEMLDDGEFQPEGQHVSSEDPKSTGQTENNSGYSQEGTVSGPDRSPSETSRQEQPNPAVEAGASGGTSDAAKNVKESPNGDEGTEGFEVDDRKTVGKGTPSDVQRGSNGVGSEKTDVVHDKLCLRGQLEVDSENGEENPTPLFATFHDPAEKDHGGSRRLGKDELIASSNSNESQCGYSSESGRDSAPLLPPPSTRTKGRSNIQPSNVRRDDSLFLAVKYAKTDTKLRRVLSEAGGPKRPKGVVHSGSNVIEHLPDNVQEVGTPEPQIRITPDEQPEVSDSWTNSLEMSFSPCFGYLGSKLEGQFMKAPLFYSLSSTVTFFAVVIFFGAGEDLDILASIITTVVICVLITIFIPRGKWAKGGQKPEGVNGHPERSGACGSCGCRRRPSSVRHSQFYRPLEEETNTTFQHEVADVSNIDPADCPQIRMVEGQDIMESGSPDSSTPDLRELNVDVHVPASPRNSEAGTGSQASARTKSRSLKAGVQTGGHSHHYDHGLSGTSEALRSTLRSLLAEAVAYDVESGQEEFVCEHHGQGVACSCFADRHLSN